MMIITRTLRRFTKLFSDENLTKKAYLNIVSGGLTYLVRLGVLFVITPMLVSGLGPFAFGMWQIVNRTIGYITPAAGQPTEALQWSIANRQVSRDYHLKRQLFGSSLVIWGLFLPLMLTAGFVIAWFTPTWFDVPTEWFLVVRLTALVLVVNVAVNILAELPQSVMKGENLGYKRVGLTILLYIIGGLFTWTALYLDTGLVGVSVAGLVTAALNGVLYLVLARVYVPWFGLARPARAVVREFLKLSGWFMGWNLIWISMISMDVVLLGMLASVELVTVYTLSKYVPEIIISVIKFLISGVAPGLGGIVGQGELGHAAKLRSELQAISWVVITAMGATVMIWNRAFLGLWVGSENYAGPLATLLIIVVVFQFVFILNDAIIIDVSLRVGKKVLLGAISVALTVGFIVLFHLLIPQEIVALSLGLILGRMILSLGYPYLVGRTLQIPWNRQVGSAVRPLLATLLLLAAGYGLERWVAAGSYSGLPGWALFFFSAASSFLILLPVAALLGLNAFQRRKIVDRFRIVLGRG